MRSRSRDLVHLFRGDLDTCVEDAETIRAYLQWAQFGGDDLGEVDEQVAELDERLLQCSRLDRLAAVVAAEEHRDLRFADERAGQRLVDRRKLDGDVAPRTDIVLAPAEEEGRPERLVAPRAERQVASTARHRMHGHAEELGVGLRLVHTRHDLRELPLRLGCGTYVESDAADVDLVPDVLAEDLDRDRETHLPGGDRALARCRRCECVDDWDLIGVKHFLGLDLGERRAPLPGDDGKDALHHRTVGIEVGQDVGRRLVERREALRVLVHVEVRRDRVFGSLEGGHMSAVQPLQAFGDHRATHECGEQRLAWVLAGDVDERRRRLRRMAAGSRRDDGEHAVALGVRHQRPCGRGEELGGGVVADIYRVAAGGERRQAVAQLDIRFAGELGQSATEFEHAVDGHHPRPTGVRHDAQPRPSRAGNARERLAGGEKVLDPVDAHYSSTAEGGGVERVVAADSTSVRSRRNRRARAASRLDDDDRFGLGEVAGGAHELARVGQGFDVEDDGVRQGVGAEVVDEVAEVDVAHGTHGDESGETDRVGDRPVQHRRAQRSRLADETDAARLRHDVSERGVEIAAWPQEAEAVRPQQADAVGPGDAHHLIFELLAGRADLLEPGRHDDRAAHAGLAALAHDVRHRLRGHGDHRQVDGARHLSDRLVGLDPMDRGRRPVHGVHNACVLGVDDVAQQRVADRALRVRGSDDGDGLWVEHPVERANLHWRPPPHGDRVIGFCTLECTP